MDELDMLLEELAKNSSQTATVPAAIPPKTLSVRTSVKRDNTTLHGQTESSGLVSGPGQAFVNHAYSEPPAPVEAGLMSPCTATRELDSIMNELLGLDLEIPEQIPTLSPPPIARKSIKNKKTEETKDSVSGKQAEENNMTKNTQHLPLTEKQSKGVDAIDDLLGSLSSDMEKMGVRTAAKGHCASCGKCIAGKMITALGQVWHPEHFVCTLCREELGTCGFFERDGKPYCEKDYQNLFSPRCAYCKGPITQNILTAMDQTWHPEHFFCSHCGDLFGTDGFLERDGKPYCSSDFYRLFAPKCSGCGEPVKENYLSAANGTWHPDCFVCADCLKPFTDGCFLEMNGRPLCSLHYHSRQGTLCGTCGEPISGRCIAALDRKFHPEHFVCAFCLRQLSQGVFKEQAGKPYCSVCHTKLFL
ncbi:leupaxin isoform X1 [Myxocyprinus asiaticus]|uniref:leupaxin isoform X1 n=2 Tax=Myxocyprinus asiaticus TaxID=70543 RepID=UPI00222243A9|nr:leupaxin isoform X1 [Myxocyprinus asiaticus]